MKRVSAVIIDKRGLVLTVAAAFFVVIIFAILLVRLEQTREHGESVVYRVRCDELNSFLDDITKDLKRATSISAKRGLVFAVGTVVTNGTPLTDASKTLSELTLNASYSGKKVPELQNQTLENWSAKIITLASQRSFETNLDVSLMQLDTVPHDSWNYWARIKITNISVRDEFGYCSFNGTLPREKKWIVANISIDGVEDPLYALGSSGYASRAIVRDNTSIGNHSNVSYINLDVEKKYYHANSNGPSLFERLEKKLGATGDPARHNYYLNMTIAALADEGIIVNNSSTIIGIETFVDVSELQGKIPSQLQPTIIKVNQSVVDHIFFGAENKGKKVVNVTSNYPWFRIDSPEHKDFYNLSAQQLYD